MKIGIDYSLATASTRGMGRYIREITRCLAASDRENTYFLYTHQPISEPLPPNFIERRLPTGNEILAEQWYLPRMARRDELNVLWCGANTFPLFLKRKIRLVATIHDLIFMHPTEGRSTLRQKIGRTYRRSVLRWGHRRIDRCASVSRYSADEIEHLLGISNVEVTYNCIDTFYRVVESRPKPEVRADFYFTLSGDAPSKNLPLLLDTFEELLPDQTLVVGGLPSRSPLRARATDRIRFLPTGITDEELADTYLRCRAFVFVSLSEGFGIPVLEALACGAPMVCSSTTSLPEVTGTLALLVDPTNKKAIAAALKNICTFVVDHSQKEMHLSKFLHWSDSAEKIKQLLVR